MNWLLVASLLAVDGPPVDRLILGTVVLAPWAAVPLAMLLLAYGVAKNRAGHRDDEVLAMVALAGELRAGQSLRSAVAALAIRDRSFEKASRLAMAGRPMNEVAEAMGEATGRFGQIVSTAFRVAGDSGGGAARTFEQLAAQAMAIDDLEREEKAAAAPAMAQAVIVGGVPALVLGAMLVGGRIGETFSSGPVQAFSVGVGSLLVVVGIAWVSLVAWRAR